MLHDNFKIQKPLSQLQGHLIQQTSPLSTEYGSFFFEKR